MTSPSSPEAAAVAGIAQRVVDAWSEHDAEAFADIFTADASMVLSGDVYLGRDEIREFMANAFKGPYEGTRVTGQPLSLRLVGDHLGVMVTRGGVVHRDETDVSPEREIRATWVAVRDGEQWRLAAYHNSPAKPA